MYRMGVGAVVKTTSNSTAWSRRSKLTPLGTPLGTACAWPLTWPVICGWGQEIPHLGIL